jgi:hypothetical protein
MVGPCVLGGLQPRLLVVTTPNWEANGIIRAAELAQRATAALAAAGEVVTPHFWFLDGGAGHDATVLHTSIAGALGTGTEVRLRWWHVSFGPVMVAVLDA